MHELKTAIMYLESFKNKYKSIWSSFATKDENHLYIPQNKLHAILNSVNDRKTLNSISMHDLNALGILIPWDYSKIIIECCTQEDTLLLTANSVSILAELPAMCIYICQSDEPHSGFWLAINSTPAGYAINILRATPQGLRFNALLLKDYGSFLDSLTASLRAGFSSIPNTNEFQVSKMVANSLSHLIPIFSTLVFLCLNQHFMTVITNNKFDYQEQPMIINIAN
ncbi:hypothetical protein ACQIBV_004215 [Yersinia enterocolitica]|uniref:hypothetical protein n=1 Tax=Yersinia enterocolitica TaxID=630 RepID=UPI0036D75A2A